MPGAWSTRAATGQLSQGEGQLRDAAWAAAQFRGALIGGWMSREREVGL